MRSKVDSISIWNSSLVSSFQGKSKPSANDVTLWASSHSAMEFLDAN